jgi:putative alpha-1,2-mannosidase
LGVDRIIDRIVLHHAEAGGEPAEWNSGEYSLSSSTDGTDFTPLASVTNQVDTTTHTFEATNARYVRLEITSPIQTQAQTGEFACQPLDVASTCGFIEGNASQYVWMVPHDLEGLFTRMGGHAPAI